MATVNEAKAFRREAIGRLQPGYRADLLLLNAKRLGAPYLWPGHDPYATVLPQAEPGHLDMVISRGRVLLDAGQIVAVDETRLTQKLQSLYDVIWTVAGRYAAGVYGRQPAEDVLGTEAREPARLEPKVRRIVAVNPGPCTVLGGRHMSPAEIAPSVSRRLSADPRSRPDQTASLAGRETS
jgi:Amidohydrolase family